MSELRGDQARGETERAVAQSLRDTTGTPRHVRARGTAYSLGMDTGHLEITVAGTGTVSLPPERATVYLTVGFESPNKQEVLDRTTATLHEVNRHIDHLRTMDQSPTTWSSVGAIRTRSWRSFQAQGVAPAQMFGASAEVEVKFKDQGALAYFVDTWAGQPGVTVNYVRWTLTEAVRIAKEDEALTRAVAKATERAQVMARAAGFDGVRLVEIADPGMLSDRRAGSEYGTPTSATVRGGAPGGGRSESRPVDISPADVDISTRVHARFVGIKGDTGA